jgi:integrase
MGKRSTVRVTARTVAAAQPGTVLWDAELRGFGLRVLASGTRMYVLKYRAGARQRWFTIGTHGSPWTADMARNRAKELLGQVVSGGDPAGEREAGRRVVSVAELATRFLAEHVALKAKPRTAVEYRRLLERFIIPELGLLRTTDIAVKDIARLHHSLRATPRQANMTINVARKMFRLAEAWGIREPGSNPCVQVERYRENHRERFLSHQEMARLGDVLAQCEIGWTEEAAHAWRRRMRDEALASGKTELEAESFADACKPKREAPEMPSAIAALRLLLLTGARLSEALTLAWEMVDLRERVLRLPESKTGAKVIPLAPAAPQVLEGQRARRVEGNPYVFPGGVAGKALVNLQDPWQRIRGIAGLADVHIHDLRHNIASHAAMGGMSLLLIGRVLGHRSSATTARYAHFAADPVRQAAEAMAKPLTELLIPESVSAEVARLRQRG